MKSSELPGSPTEIRQKNNRGPAPQRPVSTAGRENQIDTHCALALRERHGIPPPPHPLRPTMARFSALEATPRDRPGARVPHPGRGSSGTNTGGKGCIIPEEAPRERTLEGRDWFRAHRPASHDRCQVPAGSEKAGRVPRIMLVVLAFKGCRRIPTSVHKPDIRGGTKESLPKRESFPIP